MPLYSNWLFDVLNGTALTNWSSDTIRCSLFSQAASAIVSNSSGQTYWSNILASEIAAGSGYSASGNVMTGLTISFSSHNPSVLTLNASSVSWPTSTIAARYAVIWKQTGNPNSSPLICWVDFGSTQNSSSGTFQINWNASGIVSLTSPD